MRPALKSRRGFVSQPARAFGGAPRLRLFAPALVCCALVFSAGGALAQRRGRASAKANAPAKTNAATADAPRTSSQTITVRTRPGAVVWLDEVRRGTTDEGGQLLVKNVSPGRHTLRVRAAGFAERSVPVLPAQRGALDVRLAPTTDEAELTFQKAEEAGEKAATEEARREAAELYRRAVRLRPRFAAAQVGLARVLLALDDHDGALAAIAAARRARPAYPEASAVEGRILRALSDPDGAVRAFERAVREARGFQPEAYAGIGLVREEQGDYEGAAEAIGKALAQLSDAEPVLYEVLGRVYEKLEKWKEAVAAYEKYLELAPDGKLAPAIRSIIDQLRVQAAEQEQQTPPE